MTSPASLNHFSPAINASVMMNSNSNSSSPTTIFSLRPRDLHVSVVCIAPPSIPIGGARRRRITTSPVKASDSTTVVDDPSVASSSSGATSASLVSEEEDQAAAAADKIGARVRVKVPLKVYHVPKVGWKGC
uniref:Putative ferredoxin-thioredoxin reductase, variable chain-like n=1 Tax=Davidia involucrata TaxID=16924 RepID=A0A5B6YZP9_DAVIN